VTLSWVHINSSTVSDADQTSNKVRSTELNQKESPLLRLPGEIRNMIYEDIFSAFVIHPICEGPTRDAKCTLCMEHREGFWSLSLDKAIKASLVCRQYHSETQDLIYKWSEFLISPASLSRFVATLPSAQLKVITKARVTSHDAAKAAEAFSTGEFLRQYFRAPQIYPLGMSYSQELSIIFSHIHLHKLKGLKRVILERWFWQSKCDYDPPYVEYVSLKHKRKAYEAIKHCAGNSELEVLWEYLPC
jgi:hypothetical protein